NPSLPASLYSHHGVYMCKPLAPSSLCGGRSSNNGTCPCTPEPTVSMRYLPTLPLELANPSGNVDDFELSRMRTDSHALAANTTTPAFPCRCPPLFLSTKLTPLALPALSRVTSCAIASVRMSSLPLANAGGRCTVTDW